MSAPTIATAEVSDREARTLAVPQNTASLPLARSVGWPWSGSLRNGVFLQESVRIRHLPKYASDRNFYGTGELVSMLERAANTISRQWPGSRLSVGELSARRGGRLTRHHSHRSGRDADVAFFMRDDRNAFTRLGSFLGFGRRAPLGTPPEHVRFDDERNWRLVHEWLTDPTARVQYIFVSKPLRNRLLVEGHRRGADPELLRKAAALLIQPKHGERHEDHFHVRIYCPTGHRPRCRDSAPYWAWYEGAPPGGSHAVLPTIHWRPTGD